MPDIFTPLLKPLMPYLIIIGFVAILGSIYKAFRPQIKGYFGEVLVNRILKNSLDQTVYYLLANIMLPTPTGTTQIDHIVVSRYGIFVIETKNYAGWIFGSEEEAQWTQVIYRSKHKFQNPLRQNYKHTKTISELTGIPESYFKSVIVFIDGTFKTKMPTNIMHFGGLGRHIKSFTTPIIRDEQVPEVLAVISEWASTVTRADKRAHVSNIQENLAPAKADNAPPSCPRCGNEMILRTNNKTGNQFWGCKSFPRCKGIRQIA